MHAYSNLQYIISSGSFSSPPPPCFLLFFLWERSVLNFNVGAPATSIGSEDAPISVFPSFSVTQKLGFLHFAGGISISLQYIYIIMTHTKNALDSSKINCKDARISVFPSFFGFHFVDVIFFLKNKKQNGIGISATAIV
jgi:hypothetical protein